MICMPNMPGEIERLKMQMEIIDRAVIVIKHTTTREDKTMPEKIPLAEDVEIELIYKELHAGIVGDVYGTIVGREYAETRDTPAESPWIDGFELRVDGVNITDALPQEIRDDIEDRICRGEYA